jgi:hypothetical protein
MDHTVWSLQALLLLAEANTTKDMQYNLVYAEESQTPISTAWTLRQIGVFCRYCPNANGNLFIFLHAKEGSKVQNRLAATMKQWEMSGAGTRNWLCLHLLVFSSYCPSWRFYLSDVNQELESIADVALTLEFSQNEHYASGYTQLRKLKHLEDKVLPLSARFRTTLATVTALKDANEMFNATGLCESKEYLEMSNELRYYETLLEGHLETVGLMERRVREILNLVCVSLVF